MLRRLLTLSAWVLRTISLSSTRVLRHRRWYLALAVLLLVVLVAAAWWFWWVPNWRPVRDGERLGIDVSSHQGDIDWRRVADDDIEFAYIKATEGGDFVDERFTANWTAAGVAGVERGAYHFFTLCTAGTIQAQNFLRVAPPSAPALAPAVDLELAGNCSSRPPQETVDAELTDFLRIVEADWGREVVLYVGLDFERRYPVRDWLDRPLWIRRFLLRPSEPWSIWQLHGYANVDGIDDSVDLNVMRPFP